MTENAIAKEIVDAAFRMHTTRGPGWLESVYDTVLAYELGRRGLRTVRQQPIPVVYKNIRIDTLGVSRFGNLLLWTLFGLMPPAALDPEGNGPRRKISRSLQVAPEHPKYA
jgi:hypothetical protein